MALTTVVKRVPPKVGPANVDAATLWKMEKKKIRSII